MFLAIYRYTVLNLSLYYYDLARLLGRVGLIIKTDPDPIRLDRSNRDEVSEWRLATQRQLHEGSYVITRKDS